MCVRDYVSVFVVVRGKERKKICGDQLKGFQLCVCVRELGVGCVPSCVVLM